MQVKAQPNNTKQVLATQPAGTEHAGKMSEYRETACLAGGLPPMEDNNR